MNIRRYTERDSARLVDIWLAAVRATHHFLIEDDIQFFLPRLRDLHIPALEVHVAEDDNGRVLGFAGLDGANLEMLFIDPEQHGRGVGRLLVDHAVGLKGPLNVDVNEQNPGALAFYLKCGFVQVGRSELDGSGKPFPLLHLRQIA
ncbi:MULTISPECIES: acetyltransferase [Phyllobacteriaceae]|jgi:putative acetyltransferase|uniref:GNAT family N-acetyltransferase n=1 Tax=Mesorhizobium hungaricum TaxID=1566387 RepID=A0A1C2DIH9_9HYPH|nr:MULTISPECIES: acetyltransferase [Mesorhizobium]MBN9234321.1 acetyltransferase [Mesorhizobium sp.]MDQ0332387.1 putative acetyltransferase [Mesorhizobium sp. YL-MeA3-2017]OCX14579.1 GNAT family N-acetyltransferase [Mesorhizobium hungaricum]